MAESNNITGGISDGMTVKDIAQKHNVSIEFISEQLRKGQIVEMEHTDDPKKARKIALDHIAEFSNYYIELEKMEEKLKEGEKPATLNKTLIRTLNIRGEEVRVYTVNRNFINLHEFNDFTMGGHHYVSDDYKFILPSEIYIDQDLDDTGREATIAHEAKEYELMKYDGMSYDEAHEIALKSEVPILKQAEQTSESMRIKNLHINIDGKELKAEVSTKEHAEIYGIKADKPLYVQRIFVDECDRNKGKGKELLSELENYAKENGCDVIFGYIAQKAEFTAKQGDPLYLNNIDCIKMFLQNNGYAVNADNSDFHKIVKAEIPILKEAEAHDKTPETTKENENMENKDEIRKIEESKTRIFKSIHGEWKAETTRTEKGQTFQISTMKTYSGHLVTSATKVEAKKTKDATIIRYSPLTDTFMRIDHGKVRVTENAIREAHYKALAEFDQKVNEISEKEIRNEEPEVGDILFLDGYGKSKGTYGNNWIIYDITNSQWGINYHCVEKDTLQLAVKDHVRPYSKKFGIGIYFEKGYDMKKFGIDEDKLSNMLIEAQDVKKKSEEERRIAEEAAKVKREEKEKYLSQFQKADRRKTTSIIKKYCLENFNISDISVSTEVYSGGDSMRVKYTSPEKIEALESWINNFQEGHFNGMEDIYEYDRDKEPIIIEGHILETYKYVFVSHVEGAGKKGAEGQAQSMNKYAVLIQNPDNIQKAYIFEASSTDALYPQTSPIGTAITILPYSNDNWLRLNEMADNYNKQQKETSSEIEQIEAPESIKTEKPIEEKLVSYDWLTKIPESEKYIKPVRQVKYTLSPEDKGLMDIMSGFVEDKNGLRPQMQGVYFEENGATATDAHILLHVHGKTTKQGIFNPIKKLFDATDYKDGIYVGSDEFPDYRNVVPTTANNKDAKVVSNVSIYAIKTYCEILVRGGYVSPDTQKAVFRFNDKYLYLRTEYVIKVCDALLKLGYKTTSVLTFFKSYYTAPVVFYPESISHESTYALCMPLKATDEDNISKTNVNIDEDKEAKFVFDFDQSEIYESGKYFPINTKITQSDVKDKTVIPFEDNKVISQLLKWRNTIPILDYVRVENNYATICDLESWYSVKLLSDMPDGIYDLKGTTLQPTLHNMDDFPINPREDYQLIAEISKEEFVEIMRIAQENAADDELRPQLNGVNLQISEDGKMLFQATDATTAVRYEIKHGISKINKDLSVIIPGARYLRVFEVFDCNDVMVYYGKRHIKFVCDDRTLICRTIEANYPAVQNVIPNQSHNLINLKAETLKTIATKARELKPVKGSDYDAVVVQFDKDGNIYMYQSGREKGINGEGKISERQIIGKFELIEETIGTNRKEDLILVMPSMPFYPDSTVIAFHPEKLLRLLAIKQDVYQLRFTEYNRAAIVHFELKLSERHDTSGLKEKKKSKIKKTLDVIPEPTKESIIEAIDGLRVALEYADENEKADISDAIEGLETTLEYL